MTDFWNNKAIFRTVSFLILFGLLFHSTWLDLVDRWLKMDEGLSHGFLVLAIVIYLFYQASPIVESDNLIIRIGLLFALLLLSIFWSVAQSLDINVIEQLLLPVLVVIFSACIYGVRQGVKLAPVIFLLFFAISIWDYLTVTLVEISSLVVGSWVSVLTMPALIQDNSIILPYGVIIIADGCSGSRYLVIALALGYISILFNNYKLKQAVSILVIAGLIGLFTNWIRIFSLIIIGYLSEMESSLMQDHETFGWLLFGVFLLPVMYFLPAPNSAENHTETKLKPQLSVILVSVMLLAAGPAMQLIVNKSQHRFQPLVLNLDQSWKPVLYKDFDSPLIWPNNPRELDIFESGNYYLVKASYGRSATNPKMVPYFLRLYDHSKWLELSSGIKQRSDGFEYEMSVFKHKSRPQYWAQAQLFETAGYLSTSYTSAKLYQIPALLQQKNRFSIISLLAQCEDRTCEVQQDEVATKMNLVINSLNGN